MDCTKKDCIGMGRTIVKMKRQLFYVQTSCGGSRHLYGGTCRMPQVHEAAHAIEMLPRNLIICTKDHRPVK